MKVIRWMSGVGALLIGMLVLGLAPSAQAVTTTATGNGNWGDSIWDNGVPATGYDVVIPGGRTITNNVVTASLNSLSNSGTLVFSGWNSVLTATVVTVNGMITHGSNTDTIGSITNYSDWTPDNRVYIVCSNLTVAVGGSINANGMGYTGCKTNNGSNGFPGFGPGGGPRTGSSSAQGAGYGGVGGTGRDGPGGLVYGSLTAPEDPGSGGASGYNGIGGNGGGAIKIVANGVVTVNGSITADGIDGTSNHSGGGSGGGIYITCYTLAGTGGRVSANAGNTGSPSPTGSGGGGGRIALYYNAAAQSLATRPTMAIQAFGGLSYNSVNAQSGTVYLPDNLLLPEDLTTCFKGVRIFNVTAWSPSYLSVTNADVTLAEPNFQLSVAGALTISGSAAMLQITSTNLDFNCSSMTFSAGQLIASLRSFNYGAGDMTLNGGRMDLSARLINCPANLILTNSAALHIYAGITNNADWPIYGGLVVVTNDIVTAPGSWIYPHSHETNGGSFYIRAGNVHIATNSGFNAQATGYAGGQTTSATNSPAYQGAPGQGPGRGRSSTSDGGDTGGGGGYGGYGSANRSYQIAWNSSGGGGVAYGSLTAPAEPGSGGAAGYSGSYANQYIGGNGGGLVRLETTNVVEINGTINANGGYSGFDHSGGGAGGGIYISCRVLAGTNGVITATGATSTSGNGGSGGGGRIALRYDPSAQSNAAPCSLQIQAGKGAAGSYGDAQLGTIYLPDTQMLGSNLSARIPSGRLYGFTSWAAGSLTVNSGYVVFAEPGVQVTVTNDAVVTGAGVMLGMTNGLAGLTCGGNLTLVNSGTFQGVMLNCGGSVTLATNTHFYAYANVTNGAGPDYGALVSVAGDIVLSSNSWIHPMSQRTNGASTLFRARSVVVPAFAGFNALGTGYAGGIGQSTDVNGKGPGGGAGYRSDAGSGGAHGGMGGTSRGGSLQTTNTYDFLTGPVWPGSGGGSGYNTYIGGNGGGLVRIQAANVTIDGSIDARGQVDPPGVQHAGSGAGGGIYIVCKRFGGAATGKLLADGGDCVPPPNTPQGGAGGGGRVAVWSWKGFNTFLGTASATNGAGGYTGLGTNLLATTGTVFWAEIPVPEPGMIFQLR